MSDSWVGKIPWKRKWQSSPVFLPANSVDRGAWWATVHGVRKSWIWLSNWAHTRFLDIDYICYSLFLWGEGSLLSGEWWWQSVSVYTEGKKHGPVAPCQSSFSPQLGTKCFQSTIYQCSWKNWWNNYTHNHNESKFNSWLSYLTK